MEKIIKYPFSKQLIFAKVMENPEICKELLERIFEGKTIKDISIKDKTSLQSEVSLITGVNSKSIRIDVLFEDETQWFDVEMQLENEGNLPKRSRYYSSVLDVKSLKKGDDYNDLKISYIIFICQFDYFKVGDAVYFFETFNAKNNLPYGDEAYTIIVNTKCIGEESTTGLTAGLKNLFGYINEGKVSAGDGLIKQIHEAVESLQDDEEVEYIMTLEEEYERKMSVAERKNRESLMTLEEEYERKMSVAERKAEENFEQGTAQGREQMLKLTDYLLKEQRIDDLKRVVTDSDYRRQLIAELKL